MIHVYASCGVWELVVSSGWSFNVDKKKGGRLLALELKSSLEELQKNVIEDFGFEETDADLELSYLPIGLINSSKCPPVIIGNSREKLAKSQVVELVKTGDLFLDKTVLKARFELCAMNHNFHYTVTNSNKSVWCIRCANKVCFWGARAECLKGSTYFIIKKYVGVHSCAPSNKTSAGKTASAKTIGSLLMHKYEGIKEGPKAKDIVQIMRNDYGCEISDSLAWESREYAVNAVSGIPEESYGKIPKYLHMLREANPGTHSSYKTDVDGRFRYLFIAVGQSIKGFNTVMRHVIVVDGIFLKSKFKGVLLVATAIDGNSNLYPIAFGIVDSENEQSWEWFMRQLKVVVADDNGLAFISDRQVSIAKALEKVYPLARHSICIHHLLNNMISYFKGKGLAGLISKASKAYRVVDFKKRFAHVCNISPAIGNYLMEADVKKWARCQFHGYRYDIRTNNPAESINYVLRSPREFPVIPLLNSIREMLTRWFFKRKKLISKHTHRLTIDVEEKIDRRIGKGKTFRVYPVTDSQLLVKGDTIDCFVDLDKRTCSCGKYDLLKIPCRHAIKAGFFVGREPYTLTDFLYTTGAWREAYQESINPISVPEDGWSVPQVVENSEVLPPETRRSLGRNRKCRYETVEDKIRSSQGSQGGQSHNCSRCGLGGHNRATCKMPI
ncbi:uncharacterized protein LOC106356228 [Brassica napus]|uniref:uncharacterized protein LOC106356228 n=1 Tax=Brassica napus TaxID=3708 RepID=UPI002079F1F4|nr:uncharacterized protein LOC106356228 [Brassica napus]